ncbi:hypothetical protein GOP47_0018447 [Adiantum capillus-veneris]|uniref:SH3 domain-containing protein n=1 Tax=Adiantum capillus-veneris TaxID=13818 RepID=A0A9D4UE43_ADICA|nr:hypothetical protein GOP47_0018447 [Adiantum capillus-veneris]
MASQESGSTTLMDLITSDPASLPANSALPALGKGTPDPSKASRKPGSLQAAGSAAESLSPARLISPVKTSLGPLAKKKKPVSYSQLARSLHELAAAADQKSSSTQLVHQIFPKLAVYNSVDPSLAPSLLMLHQQSEDRQVLRYVYYYLARILSDSGGQGVTPGGGISTPNWDALADLNASGGVTRADVVPRIIEQLSKEAANVDVEAHAKRIAALKALTYAPTSNDEVLNRLYEIVFGILDKVADAGKVKRKKGMFGRQTVDKESAVRSNLQYAALSTLRRLPLDPGNPAFLHRAVQGIACADPIGVRHALAVVSELATRDPYAVAMAVAKISLSGGALQEVLQLHDVLARVYLARLCFILSRARVLDERPDIRSQYQTILYQLLLDPSERVCFEAIMCILGKFDNNERLEERAGGWAMLTTAILKFPDAPTTITSSAQQAQDGSALPPKAPKERPASRPRRPQALIKLVMRRLESAFRSPIRPVLHAAARVVQEMGKSRAAAYSLRGYAVDEDSHPETVVDSGGVPANASDLASSELEQAETEAPRNKVASFPSTSGGKETISSMLSSLKEAVRTTVACECVYVRGAVIKALIWLQSPYESFDELKSIIAGELSDPSWPASLLNEIILILHARFKATPDMAVILLEIATLFATKVPGKIDSDVLQLLWKTCLLGCGPSGKHTALEAVTVVLDLPPPEPASMPTYHFNKRVSAADPKSALALQKLVQAAVWFLGENANYAASEYAWESVTPPGTALMMLDVDKMVAAASSRNPTLAGALTRLERCAFGGSWEVRLVAAQALITIAIRSGEPYRMQVYELLQALAQGGSSKSMLDMASNGEDQGATGTGLSSILSPMIRLLDEMYRAQDELVRDMRNHDNKKQEWSDDELRKLYETHERLLDLVSLFCYVPRAKYLPLGPTSATLINIYRNRHRIDAASGLNDPAVAMGISDLLNSQLQYPPVHIEKNEPLVVGLSDGLWTGSAPAIDLVNEFLVGAGTDAPEVEEENVLPRTSISYDDMWAKQLLEASETEDAEVQSSGSSSPESVASYSTTTSSHFGGMGYPSLFGGSGASRFSPWEKQLSSHPTSRVSNLSMDSSSDQLPEFLATSRMGAQKQSSSFMGRMDSFGNLPDDVLGRADDDEEPQETPQFGKALYDFTAGGDEELNLTAGEELEIEYEVDGWFHVRKKKPGRDGKIAGLVPILYVTS